MGIVRIIYKYEKYNIQYLNKIIYTRDKCVYYLHRYNLNEIF